MTDVIGVGANSVDFVYRLPDFPKPDSPFAKVPIREHRTSLGGQVTTALATCAAMGLTTTYVGTMGDDENGARMRDELTRRNIDLSHALVRQGPNPFALILLDDTTGERVVLWRRESRSALLDHEIDADAICSARLLHVDDVDLRASAAAARVARTVGLPVTSDIERTDDEVWALIDAVTIPIFAEHVPIALAGVTDLERALAALRQPHHSLLCVTRGARGAVMLNEQQTYHEAGIPVKPVDTTGAGDIFRGAFIYALLRGDAPATILHFANAAAALSCTRFGALSSVPTLAEVELAAQTDRPGSTV